MLAAALSYAGGVVADLVFNVRDLDAGTPAGCKTVDVQLDRQWLESILVGTDLRVDALVPQAALSNENATAATAGGAAQLPPASSVLRLKIERTGSDVLVRGEAKAQLIAQCIRCLEDVHLDVVAPIVALFSPPPKHLANHLAAELELTEDDLDRAFFDGEHIELDSLVRESLLLATPLQPLCSEDCPGIPIPEHVRPPADFGSSRPPADFGSSRPPADFGSSRPPAAGQVTEQAPTNGIGNGQTAVDPRLQPLAALAERWRGRTK